MPPPQTEFEVASSTPAGYIFSVTPAPLGYGSPIPSGNLSTFLVRPSVTSRGIPVPSCGSVGDRGAVVFKFDDIPTLSDDNGDFPPAPVPFPYHRFFFSPGFAVVPPPAAKYSPSSGNQLVQYDPSVSQTAIIGLAKLRSSPCFRFSFLGISLGCNSTTVPCNFNITGLNWDGTSEVVESHHEFDIAPCRKTSGCTLSHQILNSAAALPFGNLTSITINHEGTWWADDLQIAWTENDCDSAACRAAVPNTIMMERPGGN
ncbi:hypothetical protein QBC38DRAFT_373861 [Podospora fimiseda]|uniref:DUF7371 domain-containing protein n=1 Tax=Podospora fimiseda TaxID=252190 RepID=A0AAN7BGV2_9PEZI|nr:hypothetical protein QBC38DRAFT_373861 [Podospora fimiseda]